MVRNDILKEIKELKESRGCEDKNIKVIINPFLASQLLEEEGESLGYSKEDSIVLLNIHKIFPKYKTIVDMEGKYNVKTYKVKC